MNGDPPKGIEDIVRRNVAALRSKANLTQQGLADEMLLRGIAWTRETVAQVETTSRRSGSPRPSPWPPASTCRWPG